MILNPYYFLWIIYFFCNTVSLYYLIENKGFYAFGYFYPISFMNALIVYAYHLLFWGLIYYFYKKYFKKSDWCLELNNSWGWGLVFITTSFFAFNYITGAGLAGSGFSFNGGNSLNYIFVLIQPDLLYFLIAPFLISKRLFWISTIIYFLSLMSRGWMGATFLLFIVYLIRYYPVRIELKNFFLIFCFFILVLFLLPLLDAFKWGFRLGLKPIEVLSNLLQEGYWSNFSKIFESVISRFQNLNYSAYIQEHNSYFFSALLNGEFLWFFQNGIINSIYCKFDSCVRDLNIYSAEVITGETGLEWNIDPGVTGWASIFGFFSIFFFFFCIFLIFLIFNIYLRNYGKKGVLLASFFCLLYFFYGWFNAFFNTIIYAFILYYLFRIRWGR